MSTRKPISVSAATQDVPLHVTNDVTNAATKVGFVSLGCPKNLIDSEVMMGMLAQAGAQLTPDADDADLRGSLRGTERRFDARS